MSESEMLDEDLEVEDGDQVIGGMEVGPVAENPLLKEGLLKGVKIK